MAIEVMYAAPADLLDCCKAAKDADMDVDDVRLTDALGQASEIIYNLTGRQFQGTQTATIRPCLPCCHSNPRCGCTPFRINLGFWPVTAILGIWMDGEDRNVDEYHVDHYKYLVRNDGEVFPENWNNNMWADTGGEHDVLSDGYVFEIELEYGVAAPRLIQRATRDLACKLLKECLCADGNCEESDRITNISKLGVSYTMMDPLTVIKQGGGTGIYSVDLAIQTFNPSNLQSPSFFWTPDLSTTGTRTL